MMTLTILHPDSSITYKLKIIRNVATTNPILKNLHIHDIVAEYMNAGMKIVKNYVVAYGDHLYQCVVDDTTVPDIIDDTYLHANFDDLGAASIVAPQYPSVGPDENPIPAGPGGSLFRKVNTYVNGINYLNHSSGDNKT